MNLNVTQIGEETVAEVLSDEPVVRTPGDALDLLATAQYQHGATCLLLYEENLTPEFFDLKTGLAGEILQKYTNYKMKLVVIGDFGSVTSQSLKAFILESNRGRQVAFMQNRAAALVHIAAW